MFYLKYLLFRHEIRASILDAIGDDELFGSPLMRSSPHLTKAGPEGTSRVLNNMVDIGLLTCRDKTFHACGRSWDGVRAWRKACT